MNRIINTNKFQAGIFLGLFFIFLTGAAYTGNYLLLLFPFAAILFHLGWANLKAVFFLLIFSLPFSFEYNFSSSLGTDVPDEFLMIFVTGVIILYWVYDPKIVSRAQLSHPLLFFLFLWFGWMIITVFFSSEQFLSIKFLLAKSWYAGAFVLAPLILFKEKGMIRAAAVCLAAAMMFVTIIIIARHLQTGFSFATVNNSVAPFFRNHVNSSAMMVCTLPILIAFSLSGKPGAKRRLINISIAVLLLAVVISYARGAWLALIVGVIAYWFIRKRIILWAYLTVIAIVAAALFWIGRNDRHLVLANDYNKTIYHSNFREHLSATYQLQDVSTAERLYRWIAGVRMTKEHLAVGYGSNTFYNNYKQYESPAFRTWVSANDDRSTVHNYFLLLTIEQGLPGLIIFLILAGLILYYSQHLYKRIDDAFYKSLSITAGVIFTMILTLNFVSDLIETDKIGSLFFLCIALLIIADVNAKKLQSFLNHQGTKAQRNTN